MAFSAGTMSPGPAAQDAKCHRIGSCPGRVSVRLEQVAPVEDRVGDRPRIFKVVARMPDRHSVVNAMSLDRVAGPFAFLGVAVHTRHLSVTRGDR